MKRVGFAKLKKIVPYCRTTVRPGFKRSDILLGNALEFKIVLVIRIPTQ